ncbi:MAG TPA: cell division protein ZapA [Candidatus Mailhella merdavium]|nr:cell division protein ZapA [Candidatus Mailhella merdavium]
MQTYNLNIFGLEVSFKTEAEPERVQKACTYAETLYEALKLHGSHLGRDRLLTILILGITDDLLQLKQQTALRDSRLKALLEFIDKQERPDGRKV